MSIEKDIELTDESVEVKCAAPLVLLKKKNDGLKKKGPPPFPSYLKKKRSHTVTGATKKTIPIIVS